MNTKHDKWNLDRLPTKWERIYGSVFAILIFLVMSLFLYASSISLINKEATEESWVTFAVAALLFIGSSFLLVRVVFGKRSKPSARAIIFTGYVIGAMCGFFLVVSVLGLGNSSYLAGVGLTGLAGSLLIIKQGKRRGNS
mgnify:CR=1 FL=1